jgi:hypothetical protein
LQKNAGANIRFADNVFEGLNNLSHNLESNFSTEDCVVWGRESPQ